MALILWCCFEYVALFEFGVNHVLVTGYGMAPKVSKSKYKNLLEK